MSLPGLGPWLTRETEPAVMVCKFAEPRHTDSIALWTPVRRKRLQRHPVQASQPIYRYVLSQRVGTRQDWWGQPIGHAYSSTVADRPADHFARPGIRQKLRTHRVHAGEEVVMPSVVVHAGIERRRRSQGSEGEPPQRHRRYPEDRIARLDSVFEPL